MSLFDTIDGAFMNFAYGWAFSKPVRKIFYNITVTGLSVAVALVIGDRAAAAAARSPAAWDSCDLDLNLVGYVDRRPVRADVGARARACGASAASRSAGAPTSSEP